MSFHAPLKVRRELDALDIELAGADVDLETSHATALVERARAIRDEAAAVGLDVFAAVAALREGEVLLRIGAASGACLVLEQAVQELSTTTAYDLYTVALARWSDALLAVDDPSTALRVCAEGIDLVERHRYKTSAPYLRASYLRRTIALYTNGVRAACELGDHGRALRWMELSKSRQLPGPARTPLTDEMVARRDELTTALADLSERIDRFDARGRDATHLRQERRVRYDELVMLDRRDVRPAAPRPDVVPDLLADDQAVVSYYWLDRSRLMITTITPGGTRVRVRVMPTDAELQLRDFSNRAIGEAGRLVGGPRGGDVSRTVDALSPILLPDDVLDDIGNTRRLLISPHRRLHALPFGALSVGGAPLIRRASIAIIPNLASLELPAPDRRSPDVLAIGAVDCHVRLVSPEPPGSPPTMVTPPPLRLAEREAQDVAATYRRAGVPAEAYLGAAIDEVVLGDRCARAGSSPTVLHFVVHGANVESDTPLESWLLLPDSRLDGIDLVRWNLDGAVVVLSACSAGQRAIAGRRMQELPGDDLFGLQTAFFDAGARQVVGALWPVDGNVAGSILRTFHEELCDGATADVALQRGVVEFLDTANPFLDHPKYWAPFQLFTLGMPARLGGVP